MATSTSKPKCTRKPRINLDFTLSSDEGQQEHSIEPDVTGTKMQDQTNIMQHRHKKKKKLRNIFEDISFSDEERMLISQNQITEEEVSLLDGVLNKAKNKKQHKLSVKIKAKNKSSNSSYSSVSNSDISKSSKISEDECNQLPVAVNKDTCKSKQKHKTSIVNDEIICSQSSMNSTASSCHETLLLADQLDKLLLSSKKNPIKRKKKNIKTILGTQSQLVERSCSSPNQKLLQTFVLDSDHSDKENENLSPYLVRDSFLDEDDFSERPHSQENLIDGAHENEEVVAIEDSLVENEPYDKFERNAKSDQIKESHNVCDQSRQIHSSDAALNYESVSSEDDESKPLLLKQCTQEKNVGLGVSFSMQVSLNNSSENSLKNDTGCKDVSLQASFDSSPKTENDSRKNASLQASFESSDETEDLKSKHFSVQASFTSSDESFHVPKKDSRTSIVDTDSNGKSAPKTNVSTAFQANHGDLREHSESDKTTEKNKNKTKTTRVSLSEDSDCDLSSVIKPKANRAKQRDRKFHDSADDSTSGKKQRKSRVKPSDSESEDSDFETFIKSMKQPVKSKKQFTTSPPRSEESTDDSSMDDFIVPDDEISSNEDPEFYLKNDRKLRTRVNTHAYRDPREGPDSDTETEDSDSCSSGCEYSPDSSDSSDLEMDLPSGRNYASETKKEEPTRVHRVVNDDDFESEVLDKENNSPKKNRAKHSLSDSSFELPDLEPKSIRKPHKNVVSGNSYLTEHFKTNVNYDDDFANDSVFKTPKNLIVKPKTPSRHESSSSPQTPVFKTPSSRPLRLLLNESEGVPKANVMKSTVTGSFLQSLAEDMGTSRRHSEAERYVKSFKKLREELTKHLYSLYNEKVFESKLPADFEVKWNVRLTKTAGYFSHKKRPIGGDFAAGARIELSTKVCDRAERLRDTLIHEMCHAAVWIIHGVREGHGKYWRLHARKANRVFPELALVERCHDYKIECKYIYRCTSCGYEIGRHSKSLNTDAKVCGYCRAPFELMLNSSRNQSNSSSVGSTPRTSVPSTPRTPNRFAMFVKENYGTVKKSGSLSHKEVMQQLSKDFAAKNKLV